MRRLLIGTVCLVALGCGEGPLGDPVSFTVPSGATFATVVDTLSARGLVNQKKVFTVWARLKKADTRVRSGHYMLAEGSSWTRILDDLIAGRVTTEAVTIPEGWTLQQMAPRLAAISGIELKDALAALTADSAHLEWGVPGPGLEGYLFPDTYRFAEGAPFGEVIAAMVGGYRNFWTPERRARLDSLGLSEREVVTLASIVQAEARVTTEMPRIASVYHNRVREGWLLQADPTVLFALGGTRTRLLFAAMDSVADHPYNTYTHLGLPPGPIGAPGAAALDAALSPEVSEYFYFVVGAEGEHVFSRTLAEHNRAVAEHRRRRSNNGS